MAGALQQIQRALTTRLSDLLYASTALQGRRTYSASGVARHFWNLLYLEAASCGVAAAAGHQRWGRRREASSADGGEPRKGRPGEGPRPRPGPEDEAGPGPLVFERSSIGLRLEKFAWRDNFPDQDVPTSPWGPVRPPALKGFYCPSAEAGYCPAPHPVCDPCPAPPVRHPPCCPVSCAPRLEHRLAAAVTTSTTTTTPRQDPAPSRDSAESPSSPRLGTADAPGTASATTTTAAARRSCARRLNLSGQRWKQRRDAARATYGLAPPARNWSSLSCACRCRRTTSSPLAKRLDVRKRSSASGNREDGISVEEIDKKDGVIQPMNRLNIKLDFGPSKRSFSSYNIRIQPFEFKPMKPFTIPLRTLRMSAVLEKKKKGKCIRGPREKDPEIRSEVVQKEMDEISGCETAGKCSKTWRDKEKTRRDWKGGKRKR